MLIAQVSSVAVLFLAAGVRADCGYRLFEKPLSEGGQDLYGTLCVLFQWIAVGVAEVLLWSQPKAVVGWATVVAITLVGVFGTAGMGAISKTAREQNASASNVQKAKREGMQILEDGIPGWQWYIFGLNTTMLVCASALLLVEWLWKIYRS